MKNVYVFDYDQKVVCLLASDLLCPLSSDACAIPPSLTILPGMVNDVRTLDKLFDGHNSTWDDRHMWLTPFVPQKGNVVYIFFNSPVAVSMIKLWNYSKTPARGVQHFQILLDDALLYDGRLRRSPADPATSPSSSVPSDTEADFGQTVLFTRDPALLGRERGRIFPEQSNQEICFINDNKILVSKARSSAGASAAFSNSKSYPQMRPSTSVSSSE